MDELKLKIVYAGKDITADGAPYCTGLSYTDYLSGQSDEVELEFDDKDGLWRQEWNPQKGDSLAVEFGYADRVLDCGSFEVDEIEYNGPPDVVRLKGLATGIRPGFRSQVTKYHHQKSLGAIAGEIGKKYGLKVQGAPTGIVLANVYQHGDDLGFLRGLSERYGYCFKVAHGCLVFYRVADFEGKESVLTLTRDVVTGYSFRTSGAPVRKRVRQAYYDPFRKSLVSGSAVNGAAVVGDEELVDVRCSSPSELQAGADSSMETHKRDEDEISVSMCGDARLISGVMVLVQGFGAFDRGYLVKEAAHSWRRDDGYMVELKLQGKL